MNTCLPSTKGYHDLFDYVYRWIDFTLRLGAPFPLLLIGNVIIVMQLARSRSIRQRMNISGLAHDTRPVSLLMIALCVLFLVTMTPTLVMSVYFPYQREKLLALRSVDPYTAWYDAQYIVHLFHLRGCRSGQLLQRHLQLCHLRVQRIEVPRRAEEPALL
ncbi:hypothetical protein DPMN_037558 [Dreissena polymorpha]|uniref:G-protein coupled receptors family 1 profile domain-containing protein n=1 Tax=Dreissena polymorpha TaxID=45954 RepID=A0A9D4MFK8_DREPO|nr:hypothetical protein DPMN_037558 [Dreissena polymorpha]